MSPPSEEQKIYKFADNLRRVLWLTSRYPAFSSAWIARKIDKTTTSRQELQVYESQCKNRSKVPTFLLMLLYFSYCLNNLYVVYESFNLYDYQHPERNINQLNATHKSISSCLLTNCTRLSPLGRLDGKSPLEQLGEDASKLPIFSLCHPRIDQLYTPITKLDSFAILFYSLTLYTVFLFGTWTPMRQFVAPAHGESIMFIAAPQATIKLARDNARKFLTEFVRSYYNYEEFSIINHQLRLKLTNHYNPEAKQLTSRSLWRANDDYVDDKIHQDDQIEYQLAINNQNNCLSIVRSLWWRQKIAEIFCTSFVLMSVFLASIFSLVVYEISSRLILKGKLLTKYAHEMEAQNCFIWRRTDEQLNEPSETINLESIDVEWNWYILVEQLTLNICPDSIASLLFASFWVQMSETYVRLAELRMLLAVSLLAIRLHNLDRRPVMMAISQNYQHAHPSGGQLLARIHSVYTLPNLRRHFKKSLVSIPMTSLVCFKHQRWDNQQQFDYLFVTSKNNDHYYEQQFLRDLFRQQQAQESREEFNMETLEQICVNFRLCVDYIRSLHSIAAIALTIVYSLNYGYALVALICQRKLNGLSMELVIFVLIFGLLIASFLIFLSANIHANTKKLHPLLWSLIAELTQWESLRARHLRILLVKQVSMLEQEGGLALKALGMRVTYVYILQLIIWTATIFVIALK